MPQPDPYEVRQHLPELQQLESLIKSGEPWIRSNIVCHVPHKQYELPIYGLELGSKHPKAPVLGLFGGVHGIERIGSQVLIQFLHTCIERFKWDPAIHNQFEDVRLVMIPIVNPWGMWRNQRANPKGVDLMRNAPVSAMHKVPFLLGGHRISRFLPWYRGPKNEPMEKESEALCQFVESKLLSQPFSISLDCHSGFGVHDRIWFPYARTYKPIQDLNIAFQLHQLLFKTYPQHNFYRFEPQAQSYTTHGDLWDHLYDRAIEQQNQATFIPLTLELGSWLWVKKNPRQIFNLFSLFNPVLPHRHSRILRRHQTLLEFLLAACRGHQNWISTDELNVRKLTQAALDHWYSSST